LKPLTQLEFQPLFLNRKCKEDQKYIHKSLKENKFRNGDNSFKAPSVGKMNIDLMPEPEEPENPK